MLYVSIDLETTGLNPETCQVIEFAAVLADTSSPGRPVELLPSYSTYVTHPIYQGEPYALGMHAEAWTRIAKKTPGWSYLPVGLLMKDFHCWLLDQGITSPITPAGKNFGSFDLNFLRKFPGMEDLFGHRVLDPGSMYFDPAVDQKIPDLRTCLRRAGIDKPIAHTALEDALDVVSVLNYKFRQ